ncbi:MAG: anti-sigma factor [Dehalococcoidia bacterium]|nr:anti-sigma factor [Dehalococcoidia bacterium]
MTSDEARELLADYVLGLLEPEDAAAVDAAIAADPDLQAEARIYGQAAEALTASAEPTPLPPGGEERIRERVAREAGGEPELATNVARRELAAGIAAPDVGYWRRIAMGAAALFILSSIGLVAALATLLGSDEEVDPGEPGALELQLAGESGGGAIYVSPGFDQGVALIHGLTPAPADHHYAVWSEGPEGHQRAGTFRAEDGEVLVSFKALPETMDRMFVTLEADASDGKAPAGREILSTR